MDTVSRRQQAEELEEWFIEMRASTESKISEVQPVVVTFHYGGASIRFPGVAFKQGDGRQRYYLIGDRIFERTCDLVGSDHLDYVMFMFDTQFTWGSYLPQWEYDKMRDPDTLARNRFGPSMTLIEPHEPFSSERLTIDMEVSFYPTKEEQND